MSASAALAYLWLRVFYGTKRIAAREKMRLTVVVTMPSDGSYYFHDASLQRGKRYVTKPCGSTECPPCQTASSTRVDEYVRPPQPAVPVATADMLGSTGGPAPITKAHRFHLPEDTVEGPRPYTGQLKALVKVPAGS